MVLAQCQVALSVPAVTPHQAAVYVLTAIVDIQLKRLEALLVDRKIELQLDEAARDWVAQRGYEPAYGARPLKRVIQRYVQDPLAEMILSGTVKDGDTVQVTAGADGLVINGEAVRDAA